MTQPPLIVDASVVVKWVIEEEDADRAETILVDGLSGVQPLAGPPHMLGEVLNTIYQRARSIDPTKHIGRDVAADAVQRILEAPVELMSPPGLYERAIGFALAYHLPTIYDSLYVALAQMVGGQLWTADLRLLRAIGDAAPWVRPLSAYPLP